VADLAASFQAAVVDVLATKAARAAQQFGAKRLALGGASAANRTLLARVETTRPDAGGVSAAPAVAPTMRP